MRKNIERTMKELLESLTEERQKVDELIHKPENVLNLQDTLAYVKQYQKHLQNEKRKVINIAYHQDYTLHKFKESEEFINTLIKALKMSKFTIVFTISLHKLLRKFTLLKQSTN